MLKHCVQLKTGHQRPVLDLLGTRNIEPENGTVLFNTELLVALNIAAVGMSLACRQSQLLVYKLYVH
jgi:hypothetical protein